MPPPSPCRECRGQNATQPKQKMLLFLMHWYIVHHVLGLVDAWSDESERFRKKYVYPPPPISPDSLIRGTEERNKSARRERESGTVQCKRQSTKDRTGMQNSAEGTNVIVCSVRDEILFMYLQLSALCCSYLSFALFMHFRTSDLRNSWYHFYFLPIKKEKSECFIFQICSTFDLLCSNLGCF